MRSDFIQLAVMALVIVFGGAAEELLPRFLGVGFPVLLAASQWFAARRGGAIQVLLFALAAGATEDALSSLPAMTGIGFFLLWAVAVRWACLPRGAMLLAYPIFQIWLYLWVAGLQGGIFNRLLLALPLGLVTELAAGAALAWLAGKAAVDEQG